MVHGVADRSQDRGWREVTEGLVRIDVPVPFKGLRQVNLWLLRDRDGWTMIDCGWGDDATRSRIEAAWQSVVGTSRITRLLITHFHPDHIGNCRWICERWGLVPTMAAGEWRLANASMHLKGLDDIPAQEAFFRRHGLGDDDARRYRTEFLLYTDGVALTSEVETVADGDRIEIGGTSWHVLTGGGHSPEMVTLHAPERGLFLSADQILPKISSNISVNHTTEREDPLSDYFASLERLAGLIAPDTLVLPSHRDPFRDAPARARQLLEHHRERLGLMRDALLRRGPMCGADFLPELFAPGLDGTQLSFAMGEVLAHLNHLERANAVERTTDKDGRCTFVPVRHG